jgi:hypothetical protein
MASVRFGFAGSVLAGCWLVACGGSDNVNGNGGNGLFGHNSGGAVTNGGVPSAPVGGNPAGGRPATGGTPTGGNQITGGTSSIAAYVTGGTKATGGTTAATGGTRVGPALATGGAIVATGGFNATAGGTRSTGVATGGLNATTGGSRATGSTIVATGGFNATTGGSRATGGSSAVAGGARATGGLSAASGGTRAATGGGPVTGGLPSTGGVKATGGSIAATGGTKAATGGAPATGGLASTGGASAVCVAGTTRCVANSVSVVETCNTQGSAWVRSSCLDYQTCTDRACRNMCGLTATPTIPTVCFAPNGDGVNAAELIYWNDSRMTYNTYTLGGAQDNSSAASIYHDTSLTWPYYWSISSSGLVYAQFLLSQFTSPRIPNLIISAERAGIITGYTNAFFGAAWAGTTTLGSTSWGTVPYTWGLANLNVTSPLNAQLNYSGGTNEIAISITGDGFGDPIDLMDVNWVMLQIQ